MEGWTQDIRYAVRTLSKSPAFLTITVLTLALGIGANVAIFTLVNAVLLRPLPFREPDRLVRVFDDLKGAGANNVGMSVPELEDLRERSGVFEEISAGARRFPRAMRLDPYIPSPFNRIRMTASGVCWQRRCGTPIAFNLG
jgi:hypothetical protein